MLACQNGHTQIVELLLKKQVDPNVQNKDGCNALMAACGTTTDNSDIVQLLINAGADRDLQITSSIIPMINGHTALMIASHQNQLQTVNVLLKAGANPNLKSKMIGETALSKAVTVAHYKVVHELIKAGASTSNTYSYFSGPTTNNFTITELCMYALSLKNFKYKSIKEFTNFANEDTFEEALQKTQDITSNIKTEDVIETLRILLQAAPQLDNDPYSLIIATETGCTPAVDLLLKAGYDPLAVSSKHNMVNETNLNFNALTIACAEGHIEIVRLILQESVDLNIIQDNVLTPLMAACISKTGNSGIIQLLLEAGADPNIQFQSSNVPMLNGYTALMFASIHGHTKTVPLLLAAGSNPNVQSEQFGHTALMFASIKGHIQIVQLLLKAGANPNLMTTEKTYAYTALSFTVFSGHPAIVGELLKAGASTDPVSLVIRGKTIKYTIIQLCIESLLLNTDTVKEFFGNVKFDEKYKK